MADKNHVMQLTRQIRQENREAYFTLERGRGETYSSGQPTLYGHSAYPESSVLAGRERRIFIESWETWEEAQKDLAQWKVKYTESGSSFIPSSQIVAHLPDDTDY